MKSSWYIAVQILLFDTFDFVIVFIAILIIFRFSFVFCLSGRFWEVFLQMLLYRSDCEAIISLALYFYLPAPKTSSGCIIFSFLASFFYQFVSFFIAFFTTVPFNSLKPGWAHSFFYLISCILQSQAVSHTYPTYVVPLIQVFCQAFYGIFKVTFNV